MTLDDFRRPVLIEKGPDPVAQIATLGAKLCSGGDWYGVWGYYRSDREAARHELNKVVSAWFMGEDSPADDDLEMSSDAGFAFDVG